MAPHTLHAAHRHYGWDRARSPALHVAPGDAVALEVLDASDGQITPASTARDLAKLDPGRANPVVGPVHVEGARPGDALVIEVLALEGAGWGWTGLIPGFGLLTSDFPDPHLVLSRYDGRTVEPLPGVRVPQRPFPGTLGVAPAAAGPHDVIPPRRVGGNIDYRGLVAGARLALPVEVEGARWSLGDTHAAQGHGEVCGTAVETPMQVQVRCTLAKGGAPPAPRLEVPADPRRGATGKTVTTGVGPDLWTAARDAVRGMIDLLVARHGLAPEDAYCLCSIAGDLVLGEVVNAPNWVVAFEMPDDIFG
jgi:acetamidase/formamidase